MAVKTMKKNTSSQFVAGWHELTISKATDGIWNDKRIIDLNFKDYPESMHHRVFETHNKTSGDEFKIANLFRYACAGIISVLNDPTGKNPVIQYDDEATNLVDTRVNALFVKVTNTSDGKEYSRIFDLAPVVQKTEHITWTADDVERIKKGVERQYARKNTVTTNGIGTVTVDTTTSSTGDVEIPF